MHVLIIGGGIGGLATALSLQKAGIEATVFEAVPEIRPLGVGINMLPHAVRELNRTGTAGRACSSRHQDPGVGLCQPSRSADLAGGSGAARRVQLAAILDCARGAANDLAGGGTSPPRG